MNFYNSSRYFLILGLGPAGLFVTRQLYRLGKIVIGIGKSDDIGRFSKYLEHCYIADNAEELKNAVAKIKSNIDENIEGINCSDAYLTYIIEEYPEIFDQISFNYPSVEILKLSQNKNQLSKLLHNLNLPLPHQYSYPSEEINFPIIIKPKIKRKKSIISKVTFIKNKEEFSAFFKSISAKNIKPSELIFQQAIVGDNECEYGYGGFFLNGKIINDVAFIQARQYPQGVSCTAIEISDIETLSALRNLVEPLLKFLNYSGFIQFDIKRDKTSGKFYLLDVNPRPWGSISIMKPKNKNKKGNVFIPYESPSRNAFWHFPLKELMSFKNSRNISFKRCFNLIGKKYALQFDIWDKLDLKPFFAQPIIGFLKVFR